MIHFEGQSADAVWQQAVRRLRADGTVQEGRDQTTRELLHATFTITDPRQRLVFARPINPAFAIAEVLWIMAGANDMAFLRFWNPRMVRYTDEREACLFHGAYGHRLGSQPRLSARATAQLRHDRAAGERRLDQLKAAYETLLHTPHSRQVVLQIWDARRDLPDPWPRSKDIPCNLTSHLMIRNGRLEWLQVMRSNDLMWGTPYNIIQFTAMQEIVAGWLGVEVGTYNHISDSLHVYERHWGTLASIEEPDGLSPLPHNQADMRVASYAAWEQIWTQLVDAAIALTQHVDAADLLSVGTGLEGLPPAYREWMAVLTAEALCRRGHEDDAVAAAEQAGPYWGASWQRWHAQGRRRGEIVGAGGRR